MANTHHSTQVLPRNESLKLQDLPEDKTITLKKVMDRPPGTHFLGTRPTVAMARINSEEGLTEITVDSGSDITLISHNFWSSMKKPPKEKSGQKINLIQVTGRTSIEMSCQRPSARKIRNSCSASVKIPACQSRRRSRNQFGVPVSGQETVYSGTLQESGSSCDWQLRSKFLNPPQHKSKYIEKCA